MLVDPYVKVATTTTGFLADKLRALGKQVFIVPNKLSQSDVALADAAWQHKTPGKEGTVRVGYLSGTPSHNKDFATITEALIRLFDLYPSMRLVLTGPIDTDAALRPYEDRIERVPLIPRKEFFGHIATLDINLAPLELDNPFCESKSELKFFEAGIIGVPTVAVANRTFREAIADGVDGFVATKTEEWVEKLGKLIGDPLLRKEIGERARKKTLMTYTTANVQNKSYVQYLMGKMTHPFPNHFH
jgi:glycosyltransferase involved in cell wall biosynthesis